MLVSGGLLLALLAAVLFRGYLLERFLVSVLRRTLGAHATIAAVGGTVFSGLDLRGVSARGAEGAWPRVSLESERISIRYAPAALLRGGTAFLDSVAVTVAGARIDLDLTAPPAAGARPGPRRDARFVLPRLPRVTVRDSRLRIRGPGLILEADGLQGAVARADQAGEQAVEIRVDRLSLQHPAVREGTHVLEIAGSYASRRIAIAAAQVNGEQLVERARLDLGEHPGDLDLQLALGLWQGRLELGVLRRGEGTSVRWDGRAIDLQPQRILAGPALGALRGVLSTSGEVRFAGGGISTMAGTFALDWKGALLAGRAVDHLTLRGSVEQGVVRVELAEGRIGKNVIEARRATLPAAPLFGGRWRALLAASSGAFGASLGDVPALLALGGVPAGGGAAVPDHLLRLEGALEPGRIRLARGDLAAGPGRATLDAFVLDLPREDQGWGEAVFSGGATFAVPNLQDLSALFPLPPLGGSLRGGIAGAGTFARPEGRASLSGRGISVAGRALGDVELLVRGSGGRIEVESLEVRQGENRITVRDAGFPLAPVLAADRGAFLDGLSGSFTLSAADLPALAAPAGIPAGSMTWIPAAHLLTAAGTVRGREIAITAGSFAAAGGAITLRAGRLALTLPGADGKPGGSFTGDLEADIPDLGPIAPLLRLPPLEGSLKARARISGSPGAPAGSVEASGKGIVVDGHRVGDVVVRAAVQRQRLRIETLEVIRGEDRLRGSGSVDLEKRTLLEGEADLSLADVAPYLAEFVRAGIPLSGRLQVRLRAAGPPPETPLVIAAQFAGRSGGPGGHPIRGALDAAWEPGRLRIAAFELAGSGGLAVRGEGILPVDGAAAGIRGPGPLSLRARASIPALEELAFLLPPAFALTGALRGEIVVAGSWKEPELRLELAGERLQPPPGTRFAPPGPWTLAGTLAWSKAEARAEGIRLDSPALSASLSGAWSSPPALSSLLAAPRGAATGTLSLRSAFSAPDIGWLRGAAEGVRVVHGSVAGEVSVSGPAGDPALAGEVRIAGGALRYRDLPPLDSLTARATLARRSVTLQAFDGNLGGAPFSLAGSLDFADPDDPILNLRLQGRNALLYRSEGLRLRADSDLTLRGPLSALLLTGEVALTDSLYQKDFTVASLLALGDPTAKRPSPGLAGISFPDPPLRDLRFDVRLTAREPLQVRTTIARGALRPDLRVAGTGLLPLLRGPILVDTARVLLPSGALEIERGTLLFREGDPDRPALDFGGRMQAMGYDVIAQVGGTLDRPEVILSSTPPLSGEELLLLVLTGVPPRGAGADRGSTAAKASPVAVYLGRNMLKQIFGSGSGEGGTSFPDRIELQVGRELTRSGSVTLDARLLLERNPFGGGSSLYLTTEKDVYDQFNAGLKILFTFK